MTLRNVRGGLYRHQYDCSCSLCELSRKESDREELAAVLLDAADALDHAALWIEGFAIPRIQRLDGDDADVDGGNALAAGLTMKAEDIRELLKERK